VLTTDRESYPRNASVHGNGGLFRNLDSGVSSRFRAVNAAGTIGDYDEPAILN
jgi:hypothetical protein